MTRITQEKHSSCSISVVVLEEIGRIRCVKCQNNNNNNNNNYKKLKLKKKRISCCEDKSLVVKIDIVIFLSYFVENVFLNFMFKLI